MKERMLRIAEALFVDDGSEGAIEASWRFLFRWASGYYGDLDA